MKKQAKPAKPKTQALLFSEELESPICTICTATEIKAILKDVPFGAHFVKPGDDSQVYMRVKPVNWLLNSTLVNDCINKNKCFVVNIEKGTLFIMPGEKEVQRLINVELHYKKIK